MKLNYFYTKFINVFCYAVISCMMLGSQFLRAMEVPQQEVPNFLVLKWGKQKATRPGEALGSWDILMSLRNIYNNVHNNRKYEMHKAGRLSEGELFDQNYKVELGEIDLSRAAQELEQLYNPMKLELEYGYDRSTRAQLRVLLAQHDPMAFPSSHYFTGQLRIDIDRASVDQAYHNGYSYGINDREDALMLLHTQAPQIQDRTLDVLVIGGGHGNFVDGLPVLTSGFLLHDIAHLACFLHDDVKQKLNAGLLRDLQATCTYMLQDETLWQNKKTYYSKQSGVDGADIEYVCANSAHELKEKGEIIHEEVIPYNGSVSRNAFERIHRGLTELAHNLPALCHEHSLGVKANILYLPTCWSAAFVPLLEPLVADGGAIICHLTDVIGMPSFVENLCEKHVVHASPRTCIETFYRDIYEQFCDGMYANIDKASGFCPFAVVTKQARNLDLHYYYNPRQIDRAELLAHDSAFRTFREQHNKENDEFKDCVFMGHKTTGIGDSVETAGKITHLMHYLTTHGVKLHAYNEYEEFKQAVMHELR